MKISALEEYGLRCMVRLAMSKGGRQNVQEIAAQEGLTVPYVAKLMSLLRERGLVESVRGRTGGFVLARAPEAISVQDVVGALGEPLFDTGYCDNHSGSLDVCSHTGVCAIRPVWQVLGEMIDKVLSGMTLADLVRQEAQAAPLLEIGRGPLLASTAPRAAGQEQGSAKRG